MIGYAIYFFVSGYRNFLLTAPCNKEVGPRLFPLRDPVQFKDSPVVGIVLMPLVIVLYLLILYVAVHRYTDMKKSPSRRKVTFRTNTSKYHQAMEWFRKLDLPWTIIGGVLILISIIWSITAIEWTVATNKIQGVNDISTTGQLIPFIIGLFSVPTTAWGIYKNHREKAYNNNEQKEDLEFDTPLKPLNFADAGLESPNGVYTKLRPSSEQQMDHFESGPPSSELRGAMTF